MNKTFFAALALVSLSTVKAHAQEVDLEQLFKNNCSELIADFGTQTISVDYTNWQGLAIKNKQFRFRIAEGKCVSLSEVSQLKVENTDAPDVAGRFDGSIVGEEFTYRSDPTSTACVYNGSNRAMTSLKNANVVLTQPIKDAIVKNYAEELCPKMFESLGRRLSEVSAALTKRKLAEAAAQ